MNAADIPVLSIMLAIPVVAAAFCLFVRAELARIIALVGDTVEPAAGCRALDQLRSSGRAVAVYRKRDLVRAHWLAAWH